MSCKQPLYIPPVVHSNTRDNPWESRKCSLNTKETLQESSSQSTFSSQIKVLQIQLGQTYKGSESLRHIIKCLAITKIL